MNIDTLLQLFSSSFNFFKKTIKTIAPFIILYAIAINILIQLIFPQLSNISGDQTYININNDDSPFSNFSIIDIITTIVIILFAVSYFVILLNYIFATVKNRIYKTKIFYFIISWFSLMVIALIIISLAFFISNSLFIAFTILIGLYLLFAFVPPTMVDKKYSLIKSIEYSYTLAINNIGSILLFFGGVILVSFFSSFFIILLSNSIAIINGNLSILIERILGEIVSYFILIWFVLFYLKLSNSE